MTKSTLLHLRFPFSFFLLPVFLFAVAISEVGILSLEMLSVFFLLHFLVYPASNGYNSYFDKDEGSIGGLKAPPRVSKELYQVSLLMDMVAIIWAAWISLTFAGMVLIYGAVSKAYSHPSIRLKKFPMLGWLTIGIFQGFFTVWMSLVGLGIQWNMIFSTPLFWQSALLSTLLLLGSYPMTQVYQHEEDQSRGDQTISLKLGIIGTFHFTAIMFTLSTIGFVLFFNHYYAQDKALIFLLMLTPVLAYFFWWYLMVRKSAEAANFDRTMRLNLLSAVCLNAFFLLLGLMA